jgi:hypothetical protein
MPKSQTATEYLIIGAVVILISIIVVVVIGGVPSVGSGTSEQQSRLALQTADVGVISYAGGTGLNTAQMKQQASFTGFTFGGLPWLISEGESYPYLQSIPQSPLPGIAD